MTKAYRVWVVLDREYGERLFQLAQVGPIWIVDTAVNRVAAQKIWSAYPDRSHLDGVTTFKVGDDCLPEETLINEMDTIDLHHGIYSANPPYTELEVIGTVVSERIKAELLRFGFNEFQSTTEGFRAIRPQPSDDSSL